MPELAHPMTRSRRNLPRYPGRVGFVLALLAGTPTAAQVVADTARAEQLTTLQGELKTFAQPFVENWCGQCHTGREPEASLDLVDLFSTIPQADGLELLLDIREVLKTEEMPPDDEPAPDADERKRMVEFIQKSIALRKSNLDPGRVTMRRLSRAEYRNSVRDLFGVQEDVTGGFPADDLGYGFDNIGDALSVSVLHIETYAEAARRIAELAIVTEDPTRPAKRSFEVEEYKARGRVSARGDYLTFASKGSVDLPLRLPRAGEYLVRVRGFGQQAGDQPVKMAISIDGKRLTVIDVVAERGKPATYERRLELPGGEHRLILSFINDYWDPKHPKRNRRDRNLHVDYAEVIGPIDRRAIPAAQKWIFASDPGEGEPAERAQPILAAVMRRAWRRPAQPAEIARLCELVKGAVKTGDTFEQAIQLGLQAILVSPHFLFRVEPGGTNGQSDKKNERLDDYAIASRLSYFLWSSLPDEQLLTLAGKGELQDPTVLIEEARRMLADERADALATNFAAQWLELRSLEDITPDRKRFPQFTPKLRAAMRSETELFFLAVLREQRHVFELIDADFTFLNSTLAAHYGIPGVQGEQMRRVTLKDARRGGLIGHASIQTVTSNPTRTSPVKRGKWILDNILDDPPPPPDVGAGSFKPGIDLSVAATLRVQLAAHRESKACAICHNRMDPLGLALENYDAIGRWRDADHGTEIDATGKLPDGRKLDGPISLKKVLRRDSAFVRCLAKKLFLYGIGREVRATDAIAIEGMVESLGLRPTLTDMIIGTVELDAFRRRRLTK